jgi:hypothetical protein
MHLYRACLENASVSLLLPEFEFLHLSSTKSNLLQAFSPRGCEHDGHANKLARTLPHVYKCAATYAS